MKNATTIHPGWLEISNDINPIAHEALSAFLFDLGCEGIASDANKASILKTYLPFKKEFEEIRSRIDFFLRNLKDIFPEAGSFRLKIDRIEDQDWGIVWRRFFKKDQVTKRLMVIPSWEPIPPSLTCHVISIDPGPAFGTGQHPTTRMCLEAMEKVDLQGTWTMLDVGTGSGILAIYGARLGANRVTAIDLDPEAVRWAKRNIQLNDLPVDIKLSSQPLEECEESFSLVTANLILNSILDLFPHFSRILDHKGWLILSGILKEQVNDVKERLSDYGLQENQVLLKEEWACLIINK